MTNPKDRLDRVNDILNDHELRVRVLESKMRDAKIEAKVFYDELIESKLKATEAIKQLLATERTKAAIEFKGLLKEWEEAFDDDGNLDGYDNKYIKDLQKRTYKLLSNLQEKRGNK